MKRGDYGQAVDLIVDLTQRRLPKAYGYSPVDDIQIITPPKKGPVGSVELNKVLQDKLNPAENGKNEYRGFVYTYRAGDKVMQTRNNYDLVWSKGNEQGAGIFNGDIGKITAIDYPTQTAKVDFDGRIATYPFDTLPQLDLAYAITVHKSQGCEFEAVIIPVMNGFEKLSYRNLLYTAVTRAKKLLILIGSDKKIQEMVDNNKRTRRYTCLRDMLANS